MNISKAISTPTSWDVSRCASTGRRRGALGSITATTCAFPGHADVIEIIGDKGSASLNGTQLQVRLHDGTNIDFEGPDSSSGSGADPMGFSCQAHQALIADFVDAVVQRRNPVASGRDVLAVHYLIAAIVQSCGLPIRPKNGSPPRME